MPETMPLSNGKTFNFRQFAISTAFGAAILNSIVYLIGSAAGASFIINQGGAKKITLVMVFTITLIPLLIAGGVTNAIGKRSASFLTKAPVIGLILGLVSASVPIQAAETTGTAVALAANHVISSIFWFLGLRKATNS